MRFSRRANSAGDAFYLFSWLIHSTDMHSELMSETGDIVIVDAAGPFQQSTEPLTAASNIVMDGPAGERHAHVYWTVDGETVTEIVETIDESDVFATAERAWQPDDDIAVANRVEFLAACYRVQLGADWTRHYGGSVALDESVGRVDDLVDDLEGT